MQKRDQTEHCLKPEGLGTKLYQADILRDFLFASNDALEEKGMDPLKWVLVKRVN